MIKVGIVGGTGYTGVELLRLLAQHPQAERPRDHLAQGGRDAGRRHVPEPARQVRRARVRRAGEATELERATSCSSRRRTASRWRRRASSSAPACGSSISPPTSGSRTRRCSSSGTSSPHACPELLARGGVRLAGGEPRRDQDGAHRRQPGLLPDRRAARLPAAARGRRSSTPSIWSPTQVGRVAAPAARPRWR